MTATETIQPGQLVLTTNGRFVHRAKSSEVTICGKPIDRIVSWRQDGEPDCYTCQRRGDRRR